MQASLSEVWLWASGSGGPRCIRSTHNQQGEHLLSGLLSSEQSHIDLPAVLGMHHAHSMVQCSNVSICATAAGGGIPQGIQECMKDLAETQGVIQLESSRGESSTAADEYMRAFTVSGLVMTCSAYMPRSQHTECYDRHVCIQANMLHNLPKILGSYSLQLHQ